MKSKLDKEFEYLLSMNFWTNKEYLKLTNWLQKWKVDYVLSKKKSSISKTRSIYITVTKFNKFPMEIRISDHFKNHENGTPDAYHILVDYNEGISKKWLKQQIVEKAKLIQEDRKALVAQEKELKTKNKNITVKLVELKNKIKKDYGFAELRKLESLTTYGLGLIDEKIKILENYLKQQGNFK